MKTRAEQKERSHAAIVAAAARRVKKQGIAKMGVAEVMSDAGLTHGGFYSHFQNKNALAAEAIKEAARYVDEWTKGLDGKASNERYSLLMKRYLDRKHRDNPAEGCAMAALASEIAHSSQEARLAYRDEFQKTLDRVADLVGDGASQSAQERAMAVMSMCVGSLLLSRAVGDVKLSEEVLKSAREFMYEAERNTQTMRMLADKKKLKKLKKKAAKVQQDVA